MSTATRPTDRSTGPLAECVWPAALALMIGTYVACFGTFACLLHGVFHTYAYDLGTFDQGIWLAGHSTNPFVTVRGLHLLGDHVRLFAYVLAPLYWIWDDVRALLLAQTVVIAAGAVFVYLLGRRELRCGRSVVLALCASYLLHPAVQNLNLDHAHPDAFASTFILASVYFLRTERLAAFALAAALAMSCKEDVPLVYLVLGVVLIAGGRRRFGTLLALTSAAYFFSCIQVILPHFNQVGFFRLEQGYFQQLKTGAADPGWLVDRLTSPAGTRYLWALGLPVGFAAILAPLSLLPALPALAANLLSDVGYMRTVLYHYSTSIVPFLYVATLDAVRGPLAAANRPRLAAAAITVAVLGGAIAANIQYSRMPLTRLPQIATYWRSYRSDAAVTATYALLARIPAGASVSADYALVPHLSHRQRVYLFPNPFRTRNWGINNRSPHDADVVEYIIARTRIIRAEGKELIDDLVASGDFARIAGDDEIGLYRRVSTRAVAERASCGDWNGDGDVTPLDAQHIFRATMSREPCPPAVCDVDGDGAVSVRDAMLIGRRAGGSDVVLRCPSR